MSSFSNSHKNPFVSVIKKHNWSSSALLNQRRMLIGRIWMRFFRGRMWCGWLLWWLSEVNDRKTKETKNTMWSLKLQQTEWLTIVVTVAAWFSRGALAGKTTVSVLQTGSILRAWVAGARPDTALMWLYGYAVYGYQWVPRHLRTCFYRENNLEKQRENQNLIWYFIASYQMYKWYSYFSVYCNP